MALEVYVIALLLRIQGIDCNAPGLRRRLKHFIDANANWRNYRDFLSIDIDAMIILITLRIDLVGGEPVCSPRTVPTMEQRSNVSHISLNEVTHTDIIVGSLFV